MALTKSLSFSLGRKRILISNNSCNLEQFSDDFDSFAPMKRRCSEQERNDFDFDFDSDSDSDSVSSPLEALPQEILIKVVCGVDHCDLKQLFHVSKTIRNATMIAKQSHFAYSTPSKIKAFKNSIDLDFDFEECEAPNAPKQARKNNRPRIDRKKLEDISVALFTDDQEQQRRWPRRSLFM